MLSRRAAIQAATLRYRNRIESGHQAEFMPGGLLIVIFATSGALEAVATAHAPQQATARNLAQAAAAPTKEPGVRPSVPAYQR